MLAAMDKAGVGIDSKLGQCDHWLLEALMLYSVQTWPLDGSLGCAWKNVNICDTPQVA